MLPQVAPPARDADETYIYSELAIGDVPHLAEHFWHCASATPHDAINAASGLLRYEQLGEAGFERLCFHLLLAEGHAPRFWGRRGQAQQGIDLIISDGASTTVVQCKNHGQYDAGKLQVALDKFGKEWLDAQPALGKPKTFILCTSAELKDRVEWHKCKLQFWKEWGVGVEEWPRETLDKKLREQPGIVADLFGNDVAELFCRRGRYWNLGLFRPLMLSSGDKRVDRFLDLRNSGQIARLVDDKVRFDSLLSRHHQLLLGGLAGTGKTMTALDLSMAFDGGSWRVFYLRPEDTQSVDDLFDGIKSRAFRNSIFVLDDCQLDFSRVEVLLRRLRTLHRRIKLVLTARTPPKGMDLLDPHGTVFVQELTASEQVIQITANADRYRAIVGLRKPGWRDPPINHLMMLTGHDLAILDLVLETSARDDFRNASTIEDLFGSVLHEIFRSNTAHAANLRRLAAISQFDTHVPRSTFPEPFESKQNENEAAQRFLVVGGRPPTVGFGHPSAAEMMFRLLAWSHGERDMLAACVRDCADALLACQPEHAVRDLLPRLLRNRLKLVDDRHIKSALLSDKRVVALFERDRECVPTTLLSLSTFLCRDVPSPFADWLVQRLLHWAHNPAVADEISVLGYCLRSIAMADEQAHRDIEKQIGGAAMARLIAARGTLPVLLGVLQYSTDSFAGELLGAFDREQLTALIDRTIGKEASIGTLHLSLRELAKRLLPGKPGRTQLHFFEERLGGAAMARLITSSALSLSYWVYCSTALIASLAGFWVLLIGSN